MYAANCPGPCKNHSLTLETQTGGVRHLGLSTTTCETNSFAKRPCLCVVVYEVSLQIMHHRTRNASRTY